MFKDKNGAIYLGQYTNDKRHGYGLFMLITLKNYEGWWHEGKQHGLGM